MGSDWRKFIFISVAILLANEFIVGLIINWKNSPSRGAPSDPGVLPTVDEDGKKSAVANNANNQNDEKAPVLVAANDSISIDGSAAKQPTHDVRTQIANRPNPAAQDVEPLTAVATSELINNASDVDQLKDACLSYDEISKTHSISYRGVYGSWMGRTKNRNDQESVHLASRKNPWLRTSYIPYDTSHAAINSTASPLMFVPAIFNPSNCIHDLIFSLLPMASKGELKYFQAVAVKRPEWSDDDPVRDYKGDYCTLVLQQLGWFKDIITVQNNTCLDTVWIPAFMYHRTARGSSRRGITQTTDFSNEYISSVDLPIQTIHFFQQQMWKSFFTDNTHLQTREDTRRRIIFDSREGLGRDEWTNAQAIAKLVQEQLDDTKFVIDVVDDVGALTIKQQSALFQTAFILVAPHGGTISNAIFMKPNSIVFELSCGEASWIKDWVSDLRIYHSEVRAFASACKAEGHKTYYVTPSTLVNLILDVCWEGQKKKITNASNNTKS